MTPLTQPPVPLLDRMIFIQNVYKICSMSKLRKFDFFNSVHVFKRHSNVRYFKMASHKAIVQVFENYQKARVLFVQQIADLALRPQNVDVLDTGNILGK